MISNQYQNQMSFQGNLIKKGLRLPNQKFNEVAKLYQERTAGKPDLLLWGRTEQNESGKFFHSVTVYRGKEDIADIFTADLKYMFKKLSPKKLADELVNLSKKAEADNKAGEIRGRIIETESRLDSVKLKLKQNQPEEVARNLRIIAQRMEATIATNKEKLAKIKQPAVSGDWII